MLRESQPLLFAQTDHRLARGRIFGVCAEQLRTHAIVIGKTGSGKSALLERLFLAQVREGMGVGLIDPHGDLIARLLDFIPRSRTNEVVLIDGAETTAPVGLNPLAHEPAVPKHLVVSGVLAAFRKAFGEFIGPRLEHILRNALFALLDAQDVSLLGVLRMLAEDKYRARILARVRDPIVRLFWEREWPAYASAFRAEIASPVTNKVAAVLTNPLLRGMLGQLRSTVSFRSVMDEGRILLVDLSKGRIGDDASALLGTLVLASIQRATYARADVPPERRRPFTLYIDEFANFATPSFAELLAEARKYRVGLVMAGQTLPLDEGLRRAVLGNVGTLIAFRVGPEDAELLAPLMAPGFTAGDLVNLERHQIALRLAVDGQTTPPFTARTLPPASGDEYVSAGETIRKVSRERYGTPRERVDAQVRAQLD